MSWHEELRWLIPVAFIALAEVLRRRHDAEEWQRARAAPRRRR